MRSIFSDQVSNLTDIFLDDVELISINRPNIEFIESLSKGLIESRENLNLQWIQEINNNQLINNNLPLSIEGDIRSMLIDQLRESSETLSKLMGCNKIKFRLSTLRSPMCPRFHVDNLPCRLLITLCGKGTEWIPNSHVNWDILNDTSNDNIPVKTPGKVKRIKPGQWSLLKGGAWNNNYRGVVHRSPLGNDQRILLSLDPIFN